MAPRLLGMGDLYGAPPSGFGAPPAPWNGRSVGPPPPPPPPLMGPSALGKKTLSWESIGVAERLLWLDLITRPSVAPVRNEPAFSGATIAALLTKVAFYTNNSAFPIGLRVVGDALSSTVRCNFYRDAGAGDDSFIDFLSNAGAVRNETNQMVIFPGQTIYIQNKSAGILMDATDILRKLVVDVSALLDDTVWKGLAR